MSLNLSKGNMYDFITHTWNTIKGKCYHDCSYCYMKRFKQNPVRFDNAELKTNLGENNFIFVGSSCDMFSKEIPIEWIEKTLRHCWQFDNNQYLFQSKNPERMQYIYDFNLDPRSVVCTTIETNRIYPDIMRNSPLPLIRAQEISIFQNMKRFVTIEPILDFDLKEFIDMLKNIAPEQVNIGADSGNNNLPEPPKEKIIELINELKTFTIIHNKKNLERLLK